MARPSNNIGVLGDLNLGPTGRILSNFNYVGNNSGAPSDDAILYTAGSIVSHNGNIFVATQNAENIEPGATGRQSHWMDLGDTNVVTMWDATSHYEAGNLVYFRSAADEPALLYVALNAIDAPTPPAMNDNPEMDTTNWLRVGGQDITVMAADQTETLAVTQSLDNEGGRDRRRFVFATRELLDNFLRDLMLDEVFNQFTTDPTDATPISFTASDRDTVITLRSTVTSGTPPTTTVNNLYVIGEGAPVTVLHRVSPTAIAIDRPTGDGTDTPDIAQFDATVVSTLTDPVFRPGEAIFFNVQANGQLQINISDGSLSAIDPTTPTTPAAMQGRIGTVRFAQGTNISDLNIRTASTVLPNTASATDDPSRLTVTIDEATDTVTFTGPDVAPWAQTSTGGLTIPLSKLPNLQLGNTHTFASDTTPAAGEIIAAVIANAGGQRDGDDPIAWHPGDLLVIAGETPDDQNNGIFVYIGDDQGTTPVSPLVFPSGITPPANPTAMDIFAANFRVVVSVDSQVQTTLETFEPVPAVPAVPGVTRVTFSGATGVQATPDTLAATALTRFYTGAADGSGTRSEVGTADYTNTMISWAVDPNAAGETLVTISGDDAIQAQTDLQAELVAGNAVQGLFISATSTGTTNSLVVPTAGGHLLAAEETAAADMVPATRMTTSQGSLSNVAYSAGEDRIEFQGSGGTVSIDQSERITDGAANALTTINGFINHIKIGDQVYRFGPTPNLPVLALSTPPALNLYRSTAQSASLSLTATQDLNDGNGPQPATAGIDGQVYTPAIANAQARGSATVTGAGTNTATVTIPASTTDENIQDDTAAMFTVGADANVRDISVTQISYPASDIVDVQRGIGFRDARVLPTVTTTSLTRSVFDTSAITRTVNLRNSTAEINAGTGYDLAGYTYSGSGITAQDTPLTGNFSLASNSADFITLFGNAHSANPRATTTRGLTFTYVMEATPANRQPTTAPRTQSANHVFFRPYGVLIAADGSDSAALLAAFDSGNGVVINDAVRRQFAGPTTQEFTLNNNVGMRFYVIVPDVDLGGASLAVENPLTGGTIGVARNAALDFDVPSVVPANTVGYSVFEGAVIASATFSIRTIFS